MLFEFRVERALVKFPEGLPENIRVPKSLEDNWDEAVELAVLIDDAEIFKLLRRCFLEACNNPACWFWISATHDLFEFFLLFNSRREILMIDFSDSSSWIFFWTNLLMHWGEAFKRDAAVLTLLSFSSFWWIHIILL